MSTSLALAVAGWACPIALGAGVMFDPPKALFPDLSQSRVLSFDVYLENVFDTQRFTTIDRVEMIFGSDDLDVAFFSFAPSFRQAFPDFEMVNPARSGAYLDDLRITAAAPFAQPTEDLLVGTLFVEVPYLPDGAYRVGVSAFRDGGRSLIANSASPGFSEGLYGGAIVIVPEPATVLLLGLAALQMIRPRRLPTRPPSREAAEHV